jgi:hypothetical protein
LAARLVLEAVLIVFGERRPVRIAIAVVLAKVTPVIAELAVIRAARRRS